MPEFKPDFEEVAAPDGMHDAIALEYSGYDQLQVVMRIMRSAFSSIYGESWNEHQCRSMLSLPGTRLMLARYAQQPCGFAISREIAGEEELLMIAVDPKYQNAGIGLAILKKLISDAENNGTIAVFLEVRSNNPAQSLYQKLGFKKIGLRPAYYTGSNKEKFDAITYKKSL
ncbi:ribosomal protein S18-alanine N-acetyltransferase [Parasphingorhabdus cellanae]|uniref:Ribosomal protein S18-alanine N-acetyltransferase n=1 Tax=Parasphingorhabdus cellanae TaxID=2806553 RepID=A0ABX7T7Y6_9SPHN|nr:ribosomal protein S18-alanine N-acetyltransferase [Parasphingorhabdus cellanae]QTD56564.1 ribosomal protein S18-alanine N-acetyltransferase [Parasphingorhabdus cellanae]